jgi:MoaA/NifB/PqqE/SkfB family radical SAM enzyme
MLPRKVTRDYFEEFELDLSGVCNLSCPLCSRNYVHAQHMVYKNVRPLEDIIAQLDTFPNLKRAFVAGQVSEPTLYKDFLDYLRYLKSRDIYIELFTNGSTRNAAFWKEVGNILDESDQCHFTICGSTQELHEKYRVGSDLNKLLRNAEAYRSAGKNNDYIQFIKFEYNADDENSPGMQKLYDIFSHHYTVETEGVRRLNDKVVDPGEGVKPEDVRDRTIKWMYDNRPRPDDGKRYEMKCKSLVDKKIYIDQMGRMSACYVHYEYEPAHTFDGDTFDYAPILNFEFKDCWACESKCRYMIEKLGVDFVC